MYTKREVKDAARARRFQNIIMFPCSRELMDTTDGHLMKNNPVQCVAIKDAEHIYGTNVGSLKGKRLLEKDSLLPAKSQECLQQSNKNTRT